MDEEKNGEVVETTQATQKERKGFNITSMVLGIISLVFLSVWFISLPCAIIAIIFAVAGKHDAGKGMGTAGLVLGIVSLSLMLLLVIFVGGTFGLLFSAAALS